MSHEKPVKIHDGSYLVTQSGTTYTVDENLTIVSSSGNGATPTIGAIYEESGATPPGDNTYIIDGRLVGYYSGVETFGADDKITVGATGDISALYGIHATGERTTITNRGAITGIGGGAIVAYGADSVIHNFGLLSGYCSLSASGSGDVTIVNGAKADIIGLGVSVYLQSSTGSVVNHGAVHVSAGGSAFDCGGGDYIIRNDGLIDGDVWLGSGKGVLDTRGGTIHGQIGGGDGDDILITDNARYKLVESANEGADTVESTVSYKLSANVETLILIGKGDINGTGTAGDDTLIGNGGDNTLVGGAGMDTISGGKGDDVLTGASVPSASDDGPDRFVFSTGGGHDTITDYVKGSDVIDFTNWTGIESFGDVMHHAHDHPVQGHEAVLIRYGDDSVLLLGFSKSDLNDAGSDFRF